MNYLIGLDIGTTSVKSCLFDETGQLIHSVEFDIETQYPKSDWAVQNVKHIESYCRKAIRQVIDDSKVNKENILAVSFCSAMHSLVGIDEFGEPLHDAIIWSDRRSHEQLSKLSESEKQEIYKRTGTPLHPMTPFSKLLWISEHQPDLFASASYWMSIKEYVVYSWFNVRWIDYSMASATGLFNLQHLNWDKALLESLKLSKEQFSLIYSPQKQLPQLNAQLCEQLGLAKNTIFVLGAADGQLSSLGIGAIEKGEVALSVGTSGAIREYTNSIQLSEERATFCYLFDSNYYIVGGPTNNGGVVLQWLRSLIAKDTDYEQFIALADTIDIGANGVLFLPYINGERAPLWNATASGNFFGLASHHNQAHMVRAALEGITYNLYHIYQSINENKQLDCLYVNGGLSRSTVWLQLLADLFNARVYTSNTHHGAAWGACWVALMSLGKKASYEQLKTTVFYEPPIMPNIANHQQYMIVFEKYKQLLQAVKPLF